jgi:hypothetical protein
MNEIWSNRRGFHIPHIAASKPENGIFFYDGQSEDILCIPLRLTSYFNYRYIAVSTNSLFFKKAVRPEILIVFNLLRYTNHIPRFTTSKRYHNILWRLTGRKNHYL